MQSGGCRVSLGAIPYWAAWSEGQVVFSVVDTRPTQCTFVAVATRFPGKSRDAWGTAMHSAGSAFGDKQTRRIIANERFFEVTV